MEHDLFVTNATMSGVLDLWYKSFGYVLKQIFIPEPPWFRFEFSQETQHAFDWLIRDVKRIRLVNMPGNRSHI